MANVNGNGLEKFAFELFLYSMLKAKYPRTNIPMPTKSPAFSLAFNRVYLYQTLRRNIWICMFEDRYKSCGFKKFKQVSEFLFSTLILLKKMSVEMVAIHVVESLSLINELILFLRLKNCELYLHELASFWYNYFVTLKKDVGSNDLFSMLFGPFSNEEKLELRNNCIIPFKFAKNVETDEECINATPCSNDRKSKVLIKTSTTKKTEATVSLKNPGLGIRPHEELLQEFYGILTNVEETPKECNIPHLDYKPSLVSSKVNAKLSRNSLEQSHQKQTEEHGGLPILPVVISRLEQKRQKIRAAYAKRVEQNK